MDFVPRDKLSLPQVGYKQKGKFWFFFRPQMLTPPLELLSLFSMTAHVVQVR